MDYFKDITLEALIQYIEGSIAPAVKDSVETWIQADNRNLIFFNKIKDAWLDLDQIKDFGPETVDGDWANILSQITNAKGNRLAKTEIKKTPLFQRSWMQAAALILLVVSLAGGYFIGHSSNKKIENEPLVYNEIVVPKGEKSQLVLSDGTKIWVNAGSKLRFPNRFGGKSREVWLDGEAFFEVAKDKSKPFYVRTSDLNIKVLGTTFNVKAYSDENIIETTLLEGLVSLERKVDSNKDVKEIFLQPNHKAIYLKSETSVVTEEIKREIIEPLQARKIIISKPVQTEIASSWKDGKLVFEDETLENIAIKLERHYDVVIHIEDETMKRFHYSGVLKNISIEQAMKAMQLTTEFKFTIKGNQINISKK